MVNSNNPLSAYFRQAQIYVKLPSQGVGYAPNSLELNDQGEVAVMPMTARDEMIMNTPDALMNGQATVDVIRSCVPSIKDPWLMSTQDLDTVLIAIRIATYGEVLDFSVVVPTVNKKQDVQVDLKNVLDRIDATPFEPWVRLKNGLTVKLRPMNYRQLTRLQLRNYEEQRIVSTVANSQLTIEEKNKKFADAFKSMTDITVNNMIDSIESVTLQDGVEVIDRKNIKEFVENMLAEDAREIRNHLTQQNSKGQIKPLSVQSLPEYVEQGAPKTFETPLSLDTSNFFASKS